MPIQSPTAYAYHTGPGPHCPNQMRSTAGTCSAAPEYGIAPVTRRAPGHKQPSKRISFLCQTCSGPANSRPCPSAPPRIIPGLARIAPIRCALSPARAAPRPNTALPRSRVARRGTNSRQSVYLFYAKHAQVQRIHALAHQRRRVSADSAWRITRSTSSSVTAFMRLMT